MGIVQDANGERLDRTSDLLDFNAAYSWMSWLNCTSTTNYPEGHGITNTAASAYDTWWLSPGNTTITLGCVAGQSGATIASALGWHHYAMIRESPMSFKLYYDGSLIITVTANVGTGRTANYMHHGGWITDSAIWWRGTIGPSKAWTRALTAAEVVREMRTILPRNYDSLYECWPGLSGANRHRGILRARDWTEVGTLGNGDNPPISWGAAPIYIDSTTAAAATLEQEGFRFFDDDGDEDGSTALDAQDTAISLSAGTRARLRVLVNGTGNPAPTAFKLQYRRVGGSSWKDVT